MSRTIGEYEIEALKKYIELCGGEFGLGIVLSKTGEDNLLDIKLHVGTLGHHPEDIAAAANRDLTTAGFHAIQVLKEILGVNVMSVPIQEHYNTRKPTGEEGDDVSLN